MSDTELSTPVEKPVNTEPKVSIKQQAKNDAMELATILYDIYTKERSNVRVINGQNNENVS